jgi:hypothetical protein
VEAIVDEQFHRADLGDQTRQSPPAFEVCPARAARIGDRYACLSVQFVVEWVAARHARPADGAVVEDDLYLNGRVTPGVQDLPGMDRFYRRHRRLLLV